MKNFDLNSLKNLNLVEITSAKVIILILPPIKCVMDRRLPKERQRFPNRAADAPPASQPKCKIIRPSGTNNDNELSAKQKTLKAAFQSSIKLCGPQEERRSKFSLLSGVVNHLKNRHLEGSFEALSVQEILEEMFILNELKSNIVWLENEALPNNPKINVAPGPKFSFKPKYDIHNRADLYRLLKHYDNKGLGGIEYNDIAECVKDADKVIKVSLLENLKIKLSFDLSVFACLFSFFSSFIHVFKCRVLEIPCLITRIRRLSRE